MSRNRSWQTNIAAHRLIYRPHWRSDAVFDAFQALWRAILRSNSRSRRTLIHAQRATACILCLKSPRYLVVPCMEAVLEDGRLDVVAFLPLVKRDGFDLASGLGLFYLVSSKVPPALLAVLVLDLDLPFVVFHGDGDLIDSILADNIKSVFITPNVGLPFWGQSCESALPLLYNMYHPCVTESLRLSLSSVICAKIIFLSRSFFSSSPTLLSS